MLKQVEFSKKSEAKGRNGMYKLGGVHVWQTDGQGKHAGMMYVEFVSTRQRGQAGAQLVLTLEDFAKLKEFLATL